MDCIQITILKKKQLEKKLASVDRLSMYKFTHSHDFSHRWSKSMTPPPTHSGSGSCPSFLARVKFNTRSACWLSSKGAYSREALAAGSTWAAVNEGARRVPRQKTRHGDSTRDYRGRQEIEQPRLSHHRLALLKSLKHLQDGQ